MMLVTNFEYNKDGTLKATFGLKADFNIINENIKISKSNEGKYKYLVLTEHLPNKKIFKSNKILLLDPNAIFKIVELY